MKKEKPKQRYIFRPYITKNGKRIYPKNGKVFKIPVEQESFVNFKNIDVSEEVVGESIIVGAVMIDRYGKGLLKLMLGDESPEECIEFCENKEKGSMSNQE